MKFAYATNGTDIIEIDYFTGLETRVTTYPSPQDLWQRYQNGIGVTDPALLAPTAAVITSPAEMATAIVRSTNALQSRRHRDLVNVVTARIGPPASERLLGMQHCS